MKKKAIQQFFGISLFIILLNIGGNYVFKRFDLTADQRYTLSKTTLGILETIESPLVIDVFLEGNFPPEFRRLQDETRQLLEEFSAYNSNIVFQFVNPVEHEAERLAVMKQFYQQGMQPLNLTVDDKGKQTQEVVFPWAVASYGEKGTKIALLKNLMMASTEKKVISSVQHLEFAFAEAFTKITREKQKKIAIIKGNGELEDIYLADFLQSVRESYYIAPFTLDSVTKQPVQTALALNQYDLAVIANPTEPFSEEEKQVLDQYLMQGGKMLWLTDNAALDFEDLNSESGQAIAMPRDLNLTDMFFSYGFRLNSQIIKDEQAIPIKLASGNQGSQTQYQHYIWRYSPYIFPVSAHPLVKNMDGIKFEFASPVELLKNDVRKTVLLSSSPYSKPVGLPKPLSFQLVTEQTNMKDYEGYGLIPVAVLLEGTFNSMYKNRILPFNINSYKEKSVPNKMIIISDGSVIKNQIENGAPLELGFDKWTNNLYGNKDFLMNCLNYLLEDNGLINIRSKDVNLPLLDKERVYQDHTWAQMLTVGVPILLLIFFGIAFTWLRKRTYGR